jgi:hypothetical protein
VALSLVLMWSPLLCCAVGVAGAVALLRHGRGRRRAAVLVGGRVDWLGCCRSNSRARLSSSAPRRWRSSAIPAKRSASIEDGDFWASLFCTSASPVAACLRCFGCRYSALLLFLLMFIYNSASIVSLLLLLASLRFSTLLAGWIVISNYGMSSC